MSARFHGTETFAMSKTSTHHSYKHSHRDTERETFTGNGLVWGTFVEVGRRAGANTAAQVGSWITEYRKSRPWKFSFFFFFLLTPLANNFSFSFSSYEKRSGGR